MRCLALADFLRTRGAKTRFLCRSITDALADLVRGHAHELRVLQARKNDQPDEKVQHAHWLHTRQCCDAEDSLKALVDDNWDWIIVDHYALDAEWEAVVRSLAPRILVIDDIADRNHDCDLLLDQNYYTDIRQRYAGKVPEHCHMLLGPRYALLRQEFRNFRAETTPRIGPVKRVLVFFGGVDAANHTTIALESLASLHYPQLHVDAVVGSAHPQLDKIKSTCSHYGFSCHVQTSRMAELIACADLAVGAGGSTMWERCCLGLPTLTLTVANNQCQAVSDAAKNGLLIAPETNAPSVAELQSHMKSLIEDAKLRSAISKKSMRFVDGLGSKRVFRRMLRSPSITNH